VKPWRTLDARDYGPPVVEPWIATKRRRGRKGRRSPRSARHGRCHPGASDRLGWKQERLYRGQAIEPLRGLASYLNPGDRIGAVTREAIEIILPSGVRQHFYNPDVEQPWVRRVAGGPA